MLSSQSSQSSQTTAETTAAQTTAAQPSLPQPIETDVVPCKKNDYKNNNFHKVLSIDYLNCLQKVIGKTRNKVYIFG